MASKQLSAREEQLHALQVTWVKREGRKIANKQIKCIFIERIPKMQDICRPTLYCFELPCVSRIFGIIIIGPKTDWCKLGLFCLEAVEAWTEQETTDKGSIHTTLTLLLPWGDASQTDSSALVYFAHLALSHMPIQWSTVKYSWPTKTAALNNTNSVLKRITAQSVSIQKLGAHFVSCKTVSFREAVGAAERLTHSEALLPFSLSLSYRQQCTMLLN